MRPDHLKANEPFGRREPHTIIIARGNDVRHFQLRASAKIGLAALGGLLFVGYLLSTAYLVVRDDLMAGAAARQARIEYAYEDRISALRRQVDRISSRQMLDQHLVESRMAELMERQDILASRSARIAPLLQEFGQTTGSVPPIEPTSEQRAAADMPDLPFMARSKSNRPLSLADRADIAFVAMQHSLEDMEAQQIGQLKKVANKAENAAGRLAAALETVDIDSGVAQANGGMGGPLEPVEATAPHPFDAAVDHLDLALERFEATRSTAASVPLANPLPGRRISSRFGPRKDPIIGRRAMHSGLDFSSPQGVAIRATAGGVVIKAGRNGGYGRMVEIRHGNGLTTRYAHMSRIAVKKGQQIKRGAIIGKVGSTGRSTGPHLHYEVRRNGKALNPIQFLNAGVKVADLL